MRGTLGTDRQDLPSAVATEWRLAWPAMAELGVPGLCVPEPLGGFGLRVDAAVMTAMELGAALHASPYAGLTASAHALAQITDDPVVDELLGGILAGERVCAFGHLGADGRLARLVDGLPGSDALLLEQPGNGLVLFVDPSSWTVDTAPHHFDVSRTCADVTVDARGGHRLTAPGHAVALYELLLAADAVGCARRMLDRAVTYAGQRQAFGRPIGAFQAVQHRLADHAVRVRGMTLVVREAARLFGADPVRLRRAAASASLSASSGAPLILHDLLQLTGAIGFTWEYGLHFYDRRAHQDARLAANPRAARRSLADLEGWTHAR
ncbi:MULTISPECIES: acyl-CoA dehydrogenase [Pseudofrankia]|uniref:acyl-CoA dehydrogenase family protein n=1 Tax=Pseudofrankia TaxID=2994363 RepID=UPI000234CD6C